MSVPIRLQLLMDDSGVSIAGVEKLADALDSSMQRASANMTTAFDKGTDKIEAKIVRLTRVAKVGFGRILQGFDDRVPQVLANIEKIATALDRLGVRGGRGKGAGSGGFNLDSYLAEIRAANQLALTGRSAISAAPQTKQTTTEYAGQQGQKLNVTENEKGELTRVRLATNPAQDLERYTQQLRGLIRDQAFRRVSKSQVGIDKATGEAIYQRIYEDILGRTLTAFTSAGKVSRFRIKEPKLDPLGPGNEQGRKAWEAATIAAAKAAEQQQEVMEKATLSAAVSGARRRGTVDHRLAQQEQRNKEKKAQQDQAEYDRLAQQADYNQQVRSLVREGGFTRTGKRLAGIDKDTGAKIFQRIYADLHGRVLTAFTSAGNVQRFRITEPKGEIFGPGNEAGRKAWDRATQAAAKSAQQQRSDALSGELGTARTRGTADWRAEQDILAHRAAKAASDQQLFNQLERQAKDRTDAYRYLAANRFRETERQGDLGPDGKTVVPTTIKYARADGGLATLNVEAGKLAVTLPKALTHWERFQAAIGTGTRTIGTGFKSIMNLPETFGNGMIRLAGTIFVFERMARFLHRIFVQPFKDVARAIVEATEESRKFEIAMSGIVGGAGAARELNRALITRSVSSPFTVTQLREGARALAFSPTLSGRMAGGTDAAAREAEQFQSLITRLGTIDPVQGQEGALRALRELSEGGGGESFRSLRIRFGITPRIIARMVNRSMEEVRSDPGLALQGVQKFADLYLPESSLEKIGQLISVRVDKLKESLRVALSRIGDSGIYDHVAAKLGNLHQAFIGYFDTEAFDRQAQSMSRSLERIADNIAGFGRRFLKSLTGSKEEARTFSAFVDQLSVGLESLAKWSGLLPGIGESVGDVAGKIGKAFTELTNRLLDFTDSVAESQERINRFSLNPGKLISSPEGVAAKRRATANLINEAAGSPIIKAETNTRSLRAATTMRDPNASMVSKFFASSSQGLMDLGWIKDAPDVGFTGDEKAQRIYEQVEEATRDRLVAKSGDRYLDEFVNERLVRQTVEEIVARELGRGPTTRPAQQESDEMAGLSPDFPRSVKRLANDESAYPNFLQMIQGASAALNQLHDLAERQQSTFNEAVTRGRGALSANIGSESDPYSNADMFDRLRGRYDEERTRYVSAIGEGRAVLSQKVPFAPQWLGGKDPGLEIVVRDLESRLGKLTGLYGQAANALQDHLQDAALNFGVGLAGAMGDLPPEARAEISRMIIEGSTSVARDVRDILKKAGRDAKLGISELEIADQQRLISGAHTSEQERIQNYSRFGQMKLGQTAAEIERLRPMDDDDVARLRLANVQQAMPAQRAIHAKALEAYQQDPASEKNITNSAIASHEMAQLTEQSRELARQLDFVGQGFVKFGEKLRASLEDSLASGIDSVIWRAGDAREILNSLAHSITRAFSEMMAENLMKGLMRNFMQVQSSGEPGAMGSALGGVGGFIGNLFGMGGSTEARVDARLDDFFSFEQAAKGAVWPGKFKPIEAFARGAVIGKATLGLVGESGPEAIVPLSKGSVPVSLRRGQQPMINLPNGQKVPVELRRDTHDASDSIADMLGNRGWQSEIKSDAATQIKAYASGAILPGGFTPFGDTAPTRPDVSYGAGRIVAGGFQPITDARRDYVGAAVAQREPPQIASRDRSGSTGAKGASQKMEQRIIFVDSRREAEAMVRDPDVDMIVDAVSSNISHGGKIFRAMRKRG